MDNKIEFKKRRNRQLMLVPFLVIAVIFLLMIDKEGSENVIEGIPDMYLLEVSVVFIFGVLTFSFRNWRCPACNKYLGKKINPKYCADCGETLQ